MAGDGPIDELAVSLGARIVQRREGLRLSRTALAQQIGLTQPGLRAIEKGEAWPRPENLRALREALKVSLSALLDDEAPDTLALAEWLLELPEKDRQILAEIALRMGHAPPAALTAPRPPREAAPLPPAPPPPRSEEEAQPERRRRAAGRRRAG
jgi:transcriptional regulator with XRE-family HTH domain